MDKLPLYQHSRSGSPGEWLTANTAGQLEYLNQADHLNRDDKVLCREFVESNAVYGHLVICIYQVLKSHSDWRRLAVLKNHMASWLSWDTLSSLRSHQIVIDHLWSFPRWHETRYLKRVVALDTDVLCARLFGVIHTPSEYRALSNLKAHEAQAMLNLMQNLLDSSFLDSCFRNPFVGALLRLSGKSGLVPEALVQDQVILDAGSAFAAGAFGELYTGSLHGQVVAVKMFKIYQNTNIARHLKAVSRETLIWRQLSHPHVLPFICVYHLSTDSHPRIGLVSPWMKHGNVYQFLRQAPDTDRTSLVGDIAEGLSYLHSMQPKIVHGDLKAVNVLVTDAGTACIADFGLARALDSEIVNFSSWSNGHGGGSLRWMAPELFNEDDDADVHADTTTDMYAFGCVCFEIFSGSIPFHNTTNDYQIMNKVTSGRRPPRPILSEPSRKPCTDLGLSDHMWFLIEDCWKSQPGDRPTANEVIDRLPKRQSTMDVTINPRISRISASGTSENVIIWAHDIEPDPANVVISNPLSRQHEYGHADDASLSPDSEERYDSEAMGTHPPIEALIEHGNNGRRPPPVGEMTWDPPVLLSPHTQPSIPRSPSPPAGNLNSRMPPPSMQDLYHRDSANPVFHTYEHGYANDGRLSPALRHRSIDTLELTKELTEYPLGYDNDTGSFRHWHQQDSILPPSLSPWTRPPPASNLATSHMPWLSPVSHQHNARDTPPASTTDWGYAFETNIEADTEGRGPNRPSVYESVGWEKPRQHGRALPTTLGRNRKGFRAFFSDFDIRKTLGLNQGPQSNLKSSLYI